MSKTPDSLPAPEWHISKFSHSKASDETVMVNSKGGTDTKIRLMVLPSMAVAFAHITWEVISLTNETNCKDCPIVYKKLHSEQVTTECHPHGPVGSLDGRGA